MYPEDPRQNPMEDPSRRPSQVLLVLIAVGVATVVTFLAWGLLHFAEIWRARPLGI